MNIDKTIAELDLKHLLDSLSSSDFVEKWTDEHRKEFTGLVKKLGVEDLEFNVVIPITKKETEYHYRIFFNWGLASETQTKNSKNWIKVYSRRGMYFLNGPSPSMIWRPELYDVGTEVAEDDENRYYWSYWMFFNELKYAINETYNPVSGLRGAFPKKSINQALQTPFMSLMKQALRIED